MVLSWALLKASPAAPREGTVEGCVCAPLSIMKTFLFQDKNQSVAYGSPQSPHGSHQATWKFLSFSRWT